MVETLLSYALQLREVVNNTKFYQIVGDTIFPQRSQKWVIVKTRREILGYSAVFFLSLSFAFSISRPFSLRFFLVRPLRKEHLLPIIG